MISRRRLLFIACAALGFASSAAKAEETCWSLALTVTTTPVQPQIARALWRHSQMVQAVNTTKPDMVLIGDSNFQSWAPPLLQRSFPGLTILNLGMGGDRTQNVLWRLDHLALSDISPRKVVILIGTNNFMADDLPCAIASGVQAIVGRVKAVWPAAQIMVMGVPPAGRDFKFKNDVRMDINSRLQSLASSSQVTFLPTDNPMTCDSWSPCENYGSDSIHFSEKGYAILGDLIRQAGALSSAR